MAANIIPPVLHEGTFSADELRRMRQEFRDNAIFASASDAINWGERLYLLDMTQDMASTSRSFLHSSSRGGINWNDILRDTNERFDQLVIDADNLIAGRPPSDNELNDETYKSWKLNRFSPLSYWPYPFSRRYRSEWWRDRMHVLTIPSLMSVGSEERDCQANRRQTEIAFGLSLYRAERNEYPESLDMLVPAHMDSVPLDPWNGQPMRYRRESNGYLLYSVGRDGKDSGSEDRDEDRGEPRSEHEPYKDIDGDDEGFRVPKKLPPLDDGYADDDLSEEDFND